MSATTWPHDKTNACEDNTCVWSKVGLSAKIVMSEFHEDAEHFYNMDMNLQRTITSLKDPNMRPPRKVDSRPSPLLPFHALCSCIMRTNPAAAAHNSTCRDFSCMIYFRSFSPCIGNSHTKAVCHMRLPAVLPESKCISHMSETFLHCRIAFKSWANMCLHRRWSQASL